jgi:glycosyltransferase involved in cell wall biosynthesis
VKSQKCKFYALDYDKLSNDEKLIIEFDNQYSSRQVSLLDASFQGLKKGLISKNELKSLEINQITPSISDEYRFVKKYYGLPWYIFVFLIRLITLNNIVKETVCFIANLKVKRVDLYGKVNNQCLKDWESNLVNKNPKVTVIIPTLNRYKYLDRCIKDLESQTYKNFELIVVDQSEPHNDSFYKGRNIDIKLFYQPEKGLWKARNDAIRNSKGEFLLFYDDDSLVDTNWIEMHLKCLDFYEVDVSSGVSLATIGGKIPQNYSFYRWADQIDTGNVMIRKSVFKKIGLFDEQFERMRLGDGEFGFRTFLNSIPMVSSPEASRVHLKVESGGLRQMGSWDAFRPTKFFDPKPIPSVIYFYQRYLPKLNLRMAIIIGLILSNTKYSNKKHNFSLIVSIFKTIFLFPIMIVQFQKSQKIANTMILNGSKIKFDIK